ncbi:MAG: sulfatase-like hydrolase/transferase, partial [Bacteroidota bacterium]
MRKKGFIFYSTSSWFLKSAVIVLFGLLLLGCQETSKDSSGIPVLQQVRKADRKKNVIFILSDDHRYDFMGFTGKVPELQTPNMDRLASEGVHFPNAFVTTSLCSPSRASILTGLYSHAHKVVDNQSVAPDDLILFPQYLQQVGYKTGFFGKWHMGSEDDNPQPGFDHWESFKGQGVYYDPVLNINGTQTKYSDSTYISDLLTQHAVDWMERQADGEQPFFMYLSHKAVHAEFLAAKRHSGKYDSLQVTYPSSFKVSDQPVKGKNPAGKPWRGDAYYGEGRIPDWQKMQRESWHGVDYMYHGDMTFNDFYRSYCETLLGVDESIGAVLDFLDERGLASSTLVIYMGDNGFAFGEHGLIDK